MLRTNNENENGNGNDASKDKTEKSALGQSFTTTSSEESEEYSIYDQLEWNKQDPGEEEGFFWKL